MGSQDETDRWIRRFHPTGRAGTRLVCFPHAGGSASYYFPLSRSLAARFEVLSVQYPGRQDRRGEPLIDDLAKLAEQIHAALAPWAGDVAFFGHSMGAILAFEVATMFQERAGAPPVRLFVSGRRAPSRPRQQPRPVHLLDDEALLAELRRTGGTDPRLLSDSELTEIILPVVRNDYRAIETYLYRPGPALACPITALVGDHDPQTTVEEAAAWRNHGDSGFDLRVFSGGHFYLENHLKEIAETIATSL